MNEFDNMLSVLSEYLLPETTDISRKLADDFRSRRIEKNLTREELAKISGVAASNIVRFEQKGLISLSNLIDLALSIGYSSEISNIFARPKYSTMEELAQIRKYKGRKKARKIKSHE